MSGVMRGAIRTQARAGWCAAAALTTLFGLLLAASFQPNMAHAQPGDTDRFVTMGIVYAIDPADGTINVNETITVRNDRGSTEADGSITSYFWETHSIWIPTGALDLAVMSNGIQLTTELLSENAVADLHQATYSSPLEFGQTRTLDISYRLATFGDLNDSPRRINAAFFNLSIVTCCNFQQADIEIRIPTSFRVTPPNDVQFDRYEQGDDQIFRYEVTNPGSSYLVTKWFGFDTAGFERTSFDVGDKQLTLISLPDTPDWATSTGQLVNQLGVALSDLTKATWTAEQATFRQGGTPYDFDANGYGNPRYGEVVLPNGFSARGLALTLTQPFLPEEPFDEPYLNEGLIADFAAEALSSLDNHLWEPSPPSGSEFDAAVDGHWFVHQVSDEIGHGGLVELLALAATQETAFVGDASPEALFRGSNDWRRFIDLTQRRLGMESADQLFADHSLTAAEQLELERRNALVADYDDLESVTPNSAPIALRDALTNWQLDTADALLNATTAVLDEHNRTGTLARDLGLEWNAVVPDWSKATSVGELNALTQPYRSRRQLLAQIANAERSLRTDRGFLEELGFDEVEAANRLDRARMAFEADELTQARAELADLAALDDRATEAGRTTLLVNFVIPAVLVLVVLFVLWRVFATRRRRRRIETESAV